MINFKLDHHLCCPLFVVHEPQIASYSNYLPLPDCICLECQAAHATRICDLPQELLHIILSYLKGGEVLAQAPLLLHVPMSVSLRLWGVVIADFLARSLDGATP